MRQRKSSQAFIQLQKALDVTPQMARRLIDALIDVDVKYVVAPYEADAQMYYLERNGIVDAILSEDSDLLVFGCKNLITKLDQYGGCVHICRDDFSSCKEMALAGWTDAEFRSMAILSGCDYLENIPRLGLKTAHRLVRKHKVIDKVGPDLGFYIGFYSHIPDNQGYQIRWSIYSSCGLPRTISTSGVDLLASARLLSHRQSNGYVYGTSISIKQCGSHFHWAVSPCSILISGSH